MINRESNYSPNKEKKLIIDNESWAKLRGEYLFFEDAKKYLVMEDAPIAVDQMSGLLKKIQKFKNENFKGIARPLVAEKMILVDDEGVKKDAVLISYNYLTTLKKDVETIKRVIYENNSLNQSQKNKLQDKCSRMLNKIDLELSEYKKGGVEIDQEEINEEINIENVKESGEKIDLNQNIEKENKKNESDQVVSEKDDFKDLNSQDQKTQEDLNKEVDKNEVKSQELKNQENKVESLDGVSPEEEVGEKENKINNTQTSEIDEINASFKKESGGNNSEISESREEKNDSNLLAIRETSLENIDDDNAEELIEKFYEIREEFNDQIDEDVRKKIEKASLILLKEVNLSNEEELKDLENSIIKKQGSEEKIKLIASIIQKYKENKEKDSKMDDSDEGNSKSGVVVENLNNEEKDERNEEITAKSEELIEKLKEKDSELEKSNKEIKQLESELENLKKELGELNRNIGEKENSISELNEKNEEQSKKIEELKKSIEKKEEELNEKNQERSEKIQQLEKEIVEIKDEKEKKEGELRKNIEEQTEKIKKLNENLNESESRKNKLISKITALSNKINSFEVNSKQKDNDLIKIEKEKEELRLNIEELKKEKKELNSRIETLKKNNENANELSDKVEKLQNINNKIFKESKGLVKNNEELEKLLDEKNNEIEIKKSEISDLKKGTEDYIQLEKEADRLAKEKEGLEIKVEEWKNNWAEEVAKKGEFESKVKQLEEKIGRLEKTLEDYVSLEKDFQSIKEAKEKIEEEKRKLEKDSSQLSQDKDQLHQKLEEKEDEVKKLNSVLEEKDKELNKQKQKNNNLIEKNQELNYEFEEERRVWNKEKEKMEEDFKKALKELGASESDKNLIKRLYEEAEKTEKLEKVIKNLEEKANKKEEELSSYKEKEKQEKEKQNEYKEKILSCGNWSDLKTILKEIGNFKLKREKEYSFDEFEKEFLDYYRYFGKFRQIYENKNLYIREIKDACKTIGSDVLNNSLHTDNNLRKLVLENKINEKEYKYNPDKDLLIGLDLNRYLNTINFIKKNIKLLDYYKENNQLTEFQNLLDDFEKKYFNLKKLSEKMTFNIKNNNLYKNKEKEELILELGKRNNEDLNRFLDLIKRNKKYLENKNN